MGAFINYSTTSLADVNSKASMLFDLEDYTDHFNTMYIHPLDLQTKNWTYYPDEKTVTNYSDLQKELRFIISQNQGYLLGRNWVVHNIEVLEKAIKLYEETKHGVFVMIYFPESFIDSDWLRVLWNFYCNVVKKTTINIVVHTHVNMWELYEMNNEFEVSEHVRYRLYTGHENGETIVDKIYNKVKNLWKRIFHKNENKD